MDEVLQALPSEMLLESVEAYVNFAQSTRHQRVVFHVHHDLGGAFERAKGAVEDGEVVFLNHVFLEFLQRVRLVEMLLVGVETGEKALETHRTREHQFVLFVFQRVELHQ